MISKDEAFRITSREVKRSSMLVRLESLAAFFELFPNPRVAEAIKASFIAFLEDDDNYTFGEEEFQKLGFYVEDSETLDVNHISVLYSQPHRLHVVEATDGKAVLAGDLFVYFLAEIGGVRGHVEEQALVSAEIAVAYDVAEPEHIDVRSIKYEERWGIGVHLPSAHRHTH